MSYKLDPGPYSLASGWRSTIIPTPYKLEKQIIIQFVTNLYCSIMETRII